MRKLWALTLAVLIAGASPDLINNDPTYEKVEALSSVELAQKLYGQTVIIEGPQVDLAGERTGDYELWGTGAINVRKHQSGKKVGVIWTAAHVVSEYVRVGEGGRILADPISFKVQQFSHLGYPVGGAIRAFGGLVHYDPAKDIACILVLDQGILASVKGSAQWDGPKIHPVGTEVVHVGNMLGEDYSYTEGNISHLKRPDVLGGDADLVQADYAAAGGSSGVGVYTKDGKLIGIHVQGISIPAYGPWGSVRIPLSAFSYFVPCHLVWRSVGIAGKVWLIDERVGMPSWTQLQILINPDLAKVLGA